MEQFIRAVLLIGGLLTLALALGFAIEAEQVTWLWPTPDSPLSYKFVAAMQAAIAAAMLWISLTNGLHMITAGALNLMVMFGGMGVSLLRDESLLGDQSRFYAVVCINFALFNLFLFLWARRLPLPSQRPLPEGVKWSYGVFVIALASVGALLIVQQKEIMPWKLSATTSVLFGWMFFGDAFYFLYALIYPRWVNGAAQLWSFLAYDLILIGPFLAHRTKVAPELYNSLLVYIGVLLFSCALAIHFLILHPETGVLAQRRVAKEALAD